MSLAYFARLADRARGANAARDPVTVAISVMVGAYWALRNSGKLPPLSRDDTDEAIDRVAAQLPARIKTYQPGRGLDLAGWLRLTVRYDLLRACHAVASESSELVTGLFLDDEGDDSYNNAHDYATTSRTLVPAGDTETQSPHDAPLAVVYASPPLGLADPETEAELARQIEAAEQLRRTRNIPVYARRMRVSETEARRRLYALRKIQ